MANPTSHWFTWPDDGWRLTVTGQVIRWRRGARPQPRLDLIAAKTPQHTGLARYTEVVQPAIEHRE
jgi:hypothetical protein